MGSANSKATGTGPGLTPEQRAADIWIQQFEDLSNHRRQEVVNTLSLAVYASLDMTVNCDYLPRDFLRICGHDRQRREKMLQTPFLNGETLITWTICHLPAQLLLNTPYEKIPSALAVQLECIESWETNTTLTDAMTVACCTRNANRLFQLFNPYRRSRSGSLVYTFTEDVNTFRFTINNFPQHMLVEGRVDLRIICDSRLYSIGFSIRRKGEWSFFHRVVYDRSGEKKYAKTIHVDLERFGSTYATVADGLNRLKPSVFKAEVSSSDWSGEKVGGDASLLKNANEFVGRNRFLRGRIRVVNQ